MVRFVVVLLMVAGVTMATAACGRKGAPQPPPGSDYPRVYPAW